MGAGFFGRIGAAILACLFAALVPESAAAANTGISVDGAWCRVSAYRAHTAFVYLTLSLRGEPTDNLIGASTPLAATVDLIAPVIGKGRERLERVDEVELNAHVPTVLQPQGPHFLLKGLRHNVQPGQSFVMTLIFARAGKHDITVHVVDKAPADGMPGLPKGVKLN